jgi:hypothetical protein
MQISITLSLTIQTHSIENLCTDVPNHSNINVVADKGPN